MTDTLRLLVVDGSSVSRTVLMRGLNAELEGVEVTARASAEEALKACASDCFDGIAAVLPLPDMGAEEFTRQCRKLPRQRYTPLLVVSGDGDTSVRRAIIAAGVTEYFDKAQGYPALVARISEMLQQHHFGLHGRVLYVEDSPTSARVTSELLLSYGLEVVHTPDAEQALELLRAAAQPQGAPFDLVLTDYLLSGKMTGRDLARAIRTDMCYSPQALPVLVITGEGNERALNQLLEAGSNDFVTKPISAEPFMARVRTLLLVRQQHLALQRLQGQV